MYTLYLGTLDPLGKSWEAAVGSFQEFRGSLALFAFRSIFGTNYWHLEVSAGPFEVAAWAQGMSGSLSSEVLRTCNSAGCGLLAPGLRGEGGVQELVPKGCLY